ncbi:hypothetical protein EI94DRAFT_1618197 [Lactarius quietus]|nr:hypothetical protein EI94DRAFT_1618197 [Lactarius quietus]
MPCNENQADLLPGAPPPPPPVQSPNDWMPYRDRIDFELTEFLYKTVQMSAGSIDTLSQLICATIIAHGTSLENIDLFACNVDLLAKINATLVGDVPWQGLSMSYDGPRPDKVPVWMTTSYDVWYHDPRQLLHNMLANRDFHGDFDYIPFWEYDTTKRRRWRDFMSGDWAWKEADSIAQDPETHGAMLVPLILGSDKTMVSVATGQSDYYPLYLSIGNIRNHIRRSHHNAVVILGYLAIPKTEKRYSNDKEFRCFRWQLFHSSLACIISSIRPAMTTPELARTPDGHYCRIIYSIGPYIADYPEQALLARIIQGWCPCCTAWTGDALNIVGEHRSQPLTEALVNAVDLGMLWDQYGIVRDVTPFTSEFPWADIYDIIAPDILHQVIKGTYKDHLVTWVEEYLILVHGKTHAKVVLNDINCRIALAPPFPGLRRFPQGRGFKQWTGNDSKALMKVYLPVLEGHVPPEIICTFRVTVRFCTGHVISWVVLLNVRLLWMTGDDESLTSHMTQR